jgi:hypothetical protein
MMMLHTDAFNRHNKNKMSKADYVRNTRLDGVPPLVLEVSLVVVALKADWRGLAYSRYVLIPGFL